MRRLPRHRLRLRRRYLPTRRNLNAIQALIHCEIARQAPVRAHYLVHAVYRSNVNRISNTQIRLHQAHTVPSAQIRRRMARCLPTSQSVSTHSNTGVCPETRQVPCVGVSEKYIRSRILVAYTSQAETSTGYYCHGPSAETTHMTMGLAQVSTRALALRDSRSRNRLGKVWRVQ